MGKDISKLPFPALAIESNRYKELSDVHVSYRGRGYVSGGNELEKLVVEREASIDCAKIEAELKNNSLRLEIDLYF